MRLNELKSQFSSLFGLQNFPHVSLIKKKKKKKTTFFFNNILFYVDSNEMLW